MDPEEFPDYDILGASGHDLSVLLGQVEAISFGERLRTSEPFQFHPLWLECTRHAMGSAGRLRYTRQALLFCYYSIITGTNNNALEETIGNFLPYVRHCLRVCGTFKIELWELELPKDLESLIASTEGKGEGGDFESPGVMVEGKGKGKELESQMDLCIESSAGTTADEPSTLIVNHRVGEDNNEHAQSRKKRRRGDGLRSSIQDGNEDITFIEYQVASVLQYIGATKD
ncbi:MAG: hypothetical protein M1813_008346 [Trichoglossum hirsutum]|nr:MAG: hypothetical protein M1813_008346 [Trichoglossum hirsutum]